MSDVLMIIIFLKKLWSLMKIDINATDKDVDSRSENNSKISIHGILHFPL